MANHKKLGTAEADPSLIAFTCVKCDRPVRKRGVLEADAPGTMSYGKKGWCKSDTQPGNLNAIRESALRGDERIDETVRSLRRYFNEGRYKRGIPPEPSPIIWKPSDESISAGA